MWLNELLLHVNTTDSRLFGNDAAEDEDPNLLEQYFVWKEEFERFESEDQKLSIVRARKGVGKSALLAKVNHRKAPDAFVIAITGADLVGQRPFSATTALELINEWQQRICYAINVKIGQRIGVALSDDAISLVETSELAGFRSRNIVGVLVDRLKGKLGSIETTKIAATNAKELLSRFQSESSRQAIWVLIDDIDATFKNTEVDCLRTSTFFSACRALVFSVDGLRLRASVRSDVWSTIRALDEALDKVEQYIIDPRWTRREAAELLAKRVRVYLKSVAAETAIASRDTVQRDRLVSAGVVRPGPRPTGEYLDSMSDTAVNRLIFSGRWAWADEVHHVLHLFASGRPRWIMQLCRLASIEAKKAGHRQEIRLANIRFAMEAFGRRRLDDISREHTHQCPQIAYLIQSFAHKDAQYSTDALLTAISERVLKKFEVEIDRGKRTDPLEIANFLFRIEFIVGVSYGTKGNRTYVKYDEKPYLLKGGANLDDGLTWEVWPTYRQVLSLIGSGTDLTNGAG